MKLQFNWELIWQINESLTFIFIFISDINNFWMSNFNNILNEQITKSINNFVLLKESFNNYASKVIDYIKSFGKKENYQVIMSH